jgi:S1-C subfamily serine protease
VVRDEARLPMTVAVAEMPTDEPAARSDALWGLTVEPLTADDPATLLGRSFSRGVVVTEVASGSAAERAGLQRGDIVLAVKGRTVGDAATFYRELGALKPGDVVPLWVHRAGSGGAGRNEYVVLERPRRP